ncbi:MAG: hypothetical protein V7K53_06650 [Nostoc sp.]|uniref:hypothetical protein n=1 Tax=Nostoc sp. TaxID=1180 RepID=UPI002FF908F2
MATIELYWQNFPDRKAEIEEAIATIDLDYFQKDLSKLISFWKRGSDRKQGLF